MVIKEKSANGIFYLIYSSEENEPFSENNLKMLLKQSFDYNSQNNITGVLLYVKGQKLTKSNGKFMQLLEGDEKLIRSLYKRIEHDNRHKSVLLLQAGRYDNRFFSNWSMGFEQLDNELYKSLSGHFNLSNDLMECKPFSSDAPLEFLQSFYTEESN
ncbi:BLUF domain-containing protein [Pedobacter frigidisoli]|uniref:BLUF domain-containing protein n=1 Tax=Pedobacter frigidisoli TaxID=2530455 RepID=A0A4V2MMN3_9SPHI|nr:BLUF domain-containing protein [Pedobacter frigidisoli]TCD07134.1 BLUF domain-containing protein [Pedobacter frigidisoli]